MVCKKCESENVSIQMVQTSAKSKTKGKGCLFTLGRWVLIICTCGLWLIFAKKKARTKIQFKNEKIAICQACGFEWNA